MKEMVAFPSAGAFLMVVIMRLNAGNAMSGAAANVIFEFVHSSLVTERKYGESVTWS
jgi:hypothetical protein